MQSQSRWLALSSAAAIVASAAATLGAQSVAANAAAASGTRARTEFAAPSTLAPFMAGSRIFDVAGSGALQVRSGLSGSPRDILPSGTFSTVAPSPDGKYVAYTVGPAHPGPYDVRVRDV
ncbi:MAG: hypothetical protein ABI026_05105, partial [Gemmatimonadaceae bacterium]